MTVGPINFKASLLEETRRSGITKVDHPTRFISQTNPVL